MSFLTPLFLLGGIAIAAPIVFHLIRRATRERTAFSSLMFLQPSPPRISKRHRLEHILLLVLRCLALGLLALGFARPFLSRTDASDPTATPPKHSVVLVDVSASMRRDGAWAAAQARVEALLRQTGPADQIALSTFARETVTLISFDEWKQTAPADRVAVAMGRLRGVAPGWGGTHLGNALVKAAETLGELDSQTLPGPRQVVVVSDFQAGTRLEGLQAYEWPKGVALVIEGVKARTVTNAGLQLVAETDDSSARGASVVRVRVTNSADSKREQFKIGWLRAGPAADFVGPAIDAYVSPGQSRVFAVPLPKDSPALEQIGLRGDDEEFDNIVHVIPSVQQQATVLWLGNDAPDDPRQPLFFLRNAYTDTPGTAVKVVSRAPGKPLSPEEVGAAHLIFVADPLPPETAAALRQQALAGKVIVFAPKSAVAGATLGALLGRDGIVLEEARPGGYAMFAEIDFQHPLFAPFADPRFSDFTKIHIWKYRKLDLAGIPDARVLARFDRGDPALVEVPLGRGRLLALTAGWQPDDSQLAVSSKFVPLLWSMLELGGGVPNFSSRFFVGDKVPLPAGAGATNVRGPGGVNFPVPAAALDFTPPPQPGVYEFTGGTRTQRFAVNLDANESRTAPLSSDELEHLGLPVTHGPATAALPAANKARPRDIENENRQKLWRWFIAATLAVLLAESALAGWTTRRTAVATGEAAS